MTPTATKTGEQISSKVAYLTRALKTPTIDRTGLGRPRHPRQG